MKDIDRKLYIIEYIPPIKPIKWTETESLLLISSDNAQYFHRSMLFSDVYWLEVIFNYHHNQ